jgi:nitrogen fixation protein FixH
MSGLLPSLGIGVGLAFLAFVLLYRLSSMSGKQVGFLVAVAVLAIYLPLAIITWPGADVFALHIALYLITPYGLAIITSHREGQEARTRAGRWFHWGPATIVGFFCVIALVDAVIISLADKGMPTSIAARLLPPPQSGSAVTSFFPGTVPRDFHEKEALYNAYLEQLAAQEARGWQVRRGWLDTPVMEEPASFRVEVLDRDGAPVRDARVEAHFYRPSDRREDTTWALVETEPGRYEAALSLPLPGMWEVLIEIRRAEDLHEVRGTTSVQRPAPAS